MARATISFISVMLTKLVISNCSDCRGLFHIAHEWHGLSQIFLLRRWFIALSLSLQNKSFPCFNLCCVCLLATICAYGRHHPRECSWQSTCMLANRQLETLMKQGKRIITPSHTAIIFSQIINLLPHTDLTNLTKNASLHSRLPSGWKHSAKPTSWEPCAMQPLWDLWDLCEIKYLREESLLKHKSLRHIFSAVL